MFEKCVTSVKSLFNAYGVMMFLCVLLMAATLGSIAGGQLGWGSVEIFNLLLPLAACLGMHFVMRRFMGHGEFETQNKEIRDERTSDSVASLQFLNVHNSESLSPKKEG